MEFNCVEVKATTSNISSIPDGTKKYFGKLKIYKYQLHYVHFNSKHFMQITTSNTYLF